MRLYWIPICFLLVCGVSGIIATRSCCIRRSSKGHGFLNLFGCSPKARVLGKVFGPMCFCSPGSLSNLALQSRLSLRPRFQLKFPLVSPWNASLVSVSDVAVGANTAKIRNGTGFARNNAPHHLLDPWYIFRSEEAWAFLNASPAP